MSDKTYNGWTNYNTWLVKLWMDNEQSSCDYWSEQAGAYYEAAEADHYFSREERAALDLADAIKQEYEEAKNDILASTKLGSSSVWADLLGGALSDVNWYEIAQAWIETAKEQAQGRTEASV